MISRMTFFTLLTAVLFATEVPAEEVTFNASPNIALGEREVPVDLLLRLKDVSATRIAIESVLDLRQAQEILIEELTGSAFVDVCDAKISVTETGPVTLLCRPKCSFKPLSVRMRQGFSSPELSVCGVDCRSR